VALAALPGHETGVLGLAYSSRLASHRFSALITCGLGRHAEVKPTLSLSIHTEKYLVRIALGSSHDGLEALRD
jgi:hypothetical protein